MKAKEVLKILNITRPTLTKYVKTNKIKVKGLINGMYDYDEDSVFKCANITQERSTVIYARVSTQKQKNDLQNQISNLQNHEMANGYKITKTYKDIASGLSYDRGEFMTLLNDVIERKVKHVFITNKYRLTRVSFDMWKNLFKQFNCELKVINETDNENDNEDKEIFNDIISLLHCFAMKMYSSRRKKKINLIKEDLENDINL